MNLTPRGARALETAAARTGENQTDTINRALVVWTLVLDLMERGDGDGNCLTVVGPDGTVERAYFL